MDWNLYLLTSEQIKLLQDISTHNFYPRYYDGFTSFHDIRNSVDVVILDDQTGYDEFYKGLDEDEKSIREIIDEELRRREGINLNEEMREQRPHLPNYDNPEDYNPSIFDWDDNEPEVDNDYFSAGQDEAWLQSKNEISRLQQKMRDCRRYGYSHKLHNLVSIQDVDEIHDQFLSNDAELIYTYGLNNDQLQVLDNRLGRIKWNRYRLNHAINSRKSGSVTYWSGTMLGCFQVRRDSKGKVISKTIYLFIDSIRDHARTHPLNTSSYTVYEDNIIAQVFIHEMFHAYYHIDSKNFISAFLNGIVDIEEAMTEYAMLTFLEGYNKSHYKTALYDVEDKLKSHDPALQCYGLGAYLHKIWSRKGLFKNKLLDVYKTIQPAPRLSIKLVRAYVANVRSRSRFNSSLCMRYLYDIIDYFRVRIRRSSDSYCFRGQNYAYTNRMVYAVLQYYKAYTKSSLAQMQHDFDYANPNLYGAKPLFLEISSIPANQMNIDYDLNQKFTLDDGSGIEVVPLRKWENQLNGSAMRFLMKVSRLHRYGIINESVRILR